MRLEHKEMAAISKTRPAVKSLKAEYYGKPTHFPVGKAAVAEEEPGICNLSTVVIGAQASQERFSEITSGRTRWQQGLVATCNASSNETISRSRGKPDGFGARVGSSDDGGVMPSEEAEHVSPMEVTPRWGKATLDTWRFLRQGGWPA